MMELCCWLLHQWHKSWSSLSRRSTSQEKRMKGRPMLKRKNWKRKPWRNGQRLFFPQGKMEFISGMKLAYTLKKLEEMGYGFHFLSQTYAQKIILGWQVSDAGWLMHAAPTQEQSFELHYLENHLSGCSKLSNLGASGHLALNSGATFLLSSPFHVNRWCLYHISCSKLYPIDVTKCMEVLSDRMLEMYKTSSMTLNGGSLVSHCHGLG